MGFLIFVIGTGQSVARAQDDGSGGQPSNGRGDLESRARSVLAQVDLRIEGTSSGAVCIRDDDGEMIGLAAVAFGAEPVGDGESTSQWTSDGRLHAAGIAARVAARREMLGFLGREIAVRDSILIRCRSVWEEEEGREWERAVRIEEVSTEVEETIAGLLARSWILESRPVKGGVRVMAVAVPEGAPRDGGMTVEAGTAEIAKHNLGPEVLAGALPNPGSRIVIDEDGRPHAVIAWCLREGIGRATETRARLEAQRSLQSYLSGDDIESRTLLREWSRRVVRLDSARSSEPLADSPIFDEDYEDQVISRVEGQAKQLGDPIRRGSRTVVFVYCVIDSPGEFR